MIWIWYVIIRQFIKGSKINENDVLLSKIWEISKFEDPRTCFFNILNPFAFQINFLIIKIIQQKHLGVEFL